MNWIRLKYQKSRARDAHLENAKELSKFKTWPDGQEMKQQWLELADPSRPVPELLDSLVRFLDMLLHNVADSTIDEWIHQHPSTPFLEGLGTTEILVPAPIFVVMNEKMNNLNIELGTLLQTIGPGQGESQRLFLLMKSADTMARFLELILRNHNNRDPVLESGMLVRIVEHQNLLVEPISKLDDLNHSMLVLFAILQRILTGNNPYGFYREAAAKSTFILKDTFQSQKSVWILHSTCKRLFQIATTRNHKVSEFTLESAILTIYAVFLTHKECQGYLLELDFLGDFKAILQTGIFQIRNPGAFLDTDARVPFEPPNIIVMKSWEIIVHDPKPFLLNIHQSKTYISTLVHLSIMYLHHFPREFWAHMARTVFESHLDCSNELFLNLWIDFLANLKGQPKEVLCDIVLDQLVRTKHPDILIEKLMEMNVFEPIVSGVSTPQTLDIIRHLTPYCVSITTRNYFGRIFLAFLDNKAARVETMLEHCTLVKLAFWDRIDVNVLEKSLVKGYLRLCLGLINLQGTETFDPRFLFNWIWQDLDLEVLQYVLLDNCIVTCLFEEYALSDHCGPVFSKWLSDTVCLLVAHYTIHFVNGSTTMFKPSLDLVYELVLRFLNLAKTRLDLMVEWIQTVKRRPEWKTIQSILHDFGFFDWLACTLSIQNVGTILKTMELVLNEVSAHAFFDPSCQLANFVKNSNVYDYHLIVRVLLLGCRYKNCHEQIKTIIHTLYISFDSVNSRAEFLEYLVGAFETLNMYEQECASVVLLGEISLKILQEFVFEEFKNSSSGFSAISFRVLSIIYKTSITIEEFHLLLKSGYEPVPSLVRALSQQCQKARYSPIQDYFLLNDGCIFIGPLNVGQRDTHFMLSLWLRSRTDHAVFQVWFQNTVLELGYHSPSCSYCIKLVSGDRTLYEKAVASLDSAEKFQMVALRWKLTKSYRVSSLEYSMYLNSELVWEEFKLEIPKADRQHVLVGARGVIVHGEDEYDKLDAVRLGDIRVLPSSLFTGHIGSIYLMCNCSYDQVSAFGSQLYSTKNYPLDTDPRIQSIYIHPRMDLDHPEFVSNADDQLEIVFHGQVVRVSKVSWHDCLNASGGIDLIFCFIHDLVRESEGSSKNFLFHFEHINHFLRYESDRLSRGGNTRNMDKETIMHLSLVLSCLVNVLDLAHDFNELYHHLKTIYRFVHHHRVELETDYLVNILFDPFLWKFDRCNQFSAHYKEVLLFLLEYVSQNNELDQLVWKFIECLNPKDQVIDHLFDLCLNIVFVQLQKYSKNQKVGLAESGLDLVIYHLGIESSGDRVVKYLDLVLKWILASFPLHKCAHGAGYHLPLQWLDGISWELWFGHLFQRFGSDKACFDLMVKLIAVLANSRFGPENCEVAGCGNAVFLDRVAPLLLKYCGSCETLVATYPVLFSSIMTRPGDGSLILANEYLYSHWIEHLAETHEEFQIQCLTDMRGVVSDTLHQTGQENISKLCCYPFWIPGLIPLYDSGISDTIVDRANLSLHKLWKLSSEILTAMGVYAIRDRTSGEIRPNKPMLHNLNRYVWTDFDFFLHFLVHCHRTRGSASVRLWFKLIRDVLNERIGQADVSDKLHRLVEFIYYGLVHRQDLLRILDLDINSRSLQTMVFDFEIPSEEIDMGEFEHNFGVVIAICSLLLDLFGSKVPDEQETNTICLIIQLLTLSFKISGEAVFETSIELLRGFCLWIGRLKYTNMFEKWILKILVALQDPQAETSPLHLTVLRLFVNELCQLWDIDAHDVHETGSLKRVSKALQKKQQEIRQVLTIKTTIFKYHYSLHSNSNRIVDLEMDQFELPTPQLRTTTFDHAWQNFVQKAMGQTGHVTISTPISGKSQLDPCENRQRMHIKRSLIHRVQERLASNIGPPIVPRIYSGYLNGKVPEECESKTIFTTHDISWDRMKQVGSDSGGAIFSDHVEIIFYLFAFSGMLELSSSMLIFHLDRKIYSVDPSLQNRVCSYKFSLCKLTHLLLQKYLHQFLSVELKFDDGQTVLFKFKTVESRKAFVKKIVALGLGNLHPPLLGSPRDNFTECMRKDTEDWINYRISNFEYLMKLNELANRSYNDLTQYPVMPWILRDYQSPSLDLDDPKTYRDLGKPVGALNPDRLIYFLDRYWNYDGGLNGPHDKKFHYGTHYSSPFIILYYMLRLEPFTFIHSHLNGKRHDLSDRLFHSLETTWSNVLDSSSDVKELIPEFFYSSEFLRLEADHGNLFAERQDGTSISNVVLPAWCNNNPEQFVRLHRQALESPHVSENLHSWIDLIFGYKQQGEAAIQASNVFHYLTYEDALKQCSLTKNMNEQQSLFMQMFYFGTTPSLLLDFPHPKRRRIQPPKSLLVWSSVKGPPQKCVVGDVKFHQLNPWHPDDLCRVWCLDRGVRFNAIRKLGVFLPLKHQLIILSLKVAATISVTQLTRVCIGYNQSQIWWLSDRLFLTCKLWNKTLECRGASGSIQKIDSAQVQNVHCRGDIRAMALSEGRGYMVLGDSLGMVSLWKVLENKERIHLEFIDKNNFYGNETAIAFVDVNYEYKMVATAGRNSMLVHSMFPLGPMIHIHLDMEISGTAISAHGNIVVWGKNASKHLVQIYNSNGRFLNSLTLDRSFQLVLAQGDPLFALVNGSNEIHIYREFSLELVRIIQISQDVVSVCFANRDRDMCCVQSDGHLLYIKDYVTIPE